MCVGRPIFLQYLHFILMMINNYFLKSYASMSDDRQGDREISSSCLVLELIDID